MYKAIDDLIIDLSNDPFNPVLSFKIALEYERIGQTASAISFYLRTAEYGYYTHPEYVYASLLKSSQCFENQKNRDATVHNLLLKAVNHIPTRPEGWFLLARYHEKAKRWQESYTFADVGLLYTNLRLSALPTWVDYPGEYALRFEKAVAGWWVGRRDESEKSFRQLLKEDISNNYRTAIIGNLALFDEDEYVDPLEPVVTNYRKFFGTSANTILDIGTRDGDDAYYLAKHLKATKVIAVDANLSAATYTQNKYPWMSVVHSAITHEDGVTEFHVVNAGNKEATGTSSIFSKETSVDPSPEFYKDKVQKITVSSSRADSMLEKLGVKQTLDVVKIDTEGYSWQVLQGFGDRLKDVKIFHIETEETQLNEEHRTTEEVTKFMQENGFVLVDISHEWGWNIKDQIWVNPSLAVKNTECFI